MKGINVREASQEDSEEILKLLKKLDRFEHKVCPLLSSTKDQEKNREEGIKEAFENPDREKIFVAETNSGVIGTVKGKIIETSPKFSLDLVGFIEGMFVLEDFRGESIGKKLMEAVLKWLKENRIKWYELNVAVDNKEAVEFYKDQGFEEYGLILHRIDDND